MIPNQSQQKLAFYMSTILSDFATSVLRELASQLALVLGAAFLCHGREQRVLSERTVAWRVFELAATDGPFGRSGRRAVRQWWRQRQLVHL